jgi:hypothetical protein
LQRRSSRPGKWRQRRAVSEITGNHVLLERLQGAVERYNARYIAGDGSAADPHRGASASGANAAVPIEADGRIIDSGFSNFIRRRRESKALGTSALGASGSIDTGIKNLARRMSLLSIEVPAGRDVSTSSRDR